MDNGKTPAPLPADHGDGTEITRLAKRWRWISVALFLFGPALAVVLALAIVLWPRVFGPIYFSASSDPARWAFSADSVLGAGFFGVLLNFPMMVVAVFLKRRLTKWWPDVRRALGPSVGVLCGLFLPSLALFVIVPPELVTLHRGGGAGAAILVPFVWIAQALLAAVGGFLGLAAAEQWSRSRSSH